MSLRLSKKQSIFFFLLSLCQVSIAEKAGVVINAQGTVHAQKESGETISLQRRSEISKSDTIITDTASTAQIRLDDGTVFSIAEKSTFKVVNFTTKKTGETKTVVEVKLEDGAVRTKTGDIGKDNPEGFKLVTPIATMGIRGTDFATKCRCEDPIRKTDIPQAFLQQNEKIREVVCDKRLVETVVYSGAINVTNELGTSIIGKGYPAIGAIVRTNQAPHGSNEVKIETLHLPTNKEIQTVLSQPSLPSTTKREAGQSPTTSTASQVCFIEN